MNHWEFTSVNNWFSMTLPENWSEYDDGENTLAFFNTDRWSGNLRISHLRRQDVNKENNESSLYNQTKFADKPNATAVKLDKWNATFYSEETDDELIIYNWVTGSKNDLFSCSFTFDKPFLGNDWHNNELIVVSEILGSIKILD